MVIDTLPQYPRNPYQVRYNLFNFLLCRYPVLILLFSLSLLNNIYIFLLITLILICSRSCGRQRSADTDIGHPQIWLPNIRNCGPPVAVFAVIRNRQQYQAKINRFKAVACKHLISPLELVWVIVWVKPPT